MHTAQFVILCKYCKRFRKKRLTCQLSSSVDNPADVHIIAPQGSYQNMKAQAKLRRLQIGVC